MVVKRRGRGSGEKARGRERARLGRRVEERDEGWRDRGREGWRNGGFG